MKQLKTESQFADELVERVLQKIGAEIRIVILQNLRGLPRDKPVARSNGKLAWFVGRAAKYQGDTRFGKVCALGMMPRSKLLKLSKMKAADFEVELEASLATCQIEACRDPINGSVCYRLPIQQTAPQPDLAALDDPEQDSHTWDFGKALERARLEREM